MKRKRRIKLFTNLKGILSLYLILVTIVYLSSPTIARFNDVENLKHHLGVANEFPVVWDKSSLQFIGSGGDCREIFANVKNGNGSGAMDGPVKYEVYWIETGNAKNGTLVDWGWIDPLGAGEEIKLTFTPELSGNYKFKAFQRDGHPGEGVLWSNGPEGIVCEITNSNEEITNLDDNNNEKIEDKKSPEIAPDENTDQQSNENVQQESSDTDAEEEGSTETNSDQASTTEETNNGSSTSEESDTTESNEPSNDTNETNQPKTSKGQDNTTTSTQQSGDKLSSEKSNTTQTGGDLN
ncbi:amyloid fiber anchoring/assembly protein TapA [Alkalihalobacillus sp. AL-G]|nr:amyloid fiber anchoring/assembly protein TapA [Alkalihalobacillus sp. AL-G]